mmetsp:Transcript_26961/g.54525  ORF Transcript_26961/g.54525 Transcript_26961/m.54525 type:complete len:275 (+) Transcript_26961:271-1095(+)|eukprot:CAMPEP_0178726246 /NCGR_PEP_ID=MMETSP0699-20121125/27155_1 /TAXON_ID=265572 /ORGANISM="Extubocellulus spinifer, Strain CCMP396" /LENGTH=274 /DNA_ID=CAMNT_0020377735 /DNA_START=100 /DNA_END=927 /DNA_ORIENTATION=-
MRAVSTAAIVLLSAASTASAQQTLITASTSVIPTIATSDLPNLSCTLCPDGSAVRNPNQLSAHLGVTCGEIQQFAPLSEAGTEDCIRLQLVGMVECGCPYVPPPSTQCKICGDDGEEDDSNTNGLVPEPMMLVDPTDEFTACGVYEWEYSVSSVSEAECGDIRDRIGLTCGCRRRMVSDGSHSRQSEKGARGLHVKVAFGAFAASLIIVVVAAVMLALRQPVKRTGNAQGDVESSGAGDLVNVNSTYFKNLSTIYEDNEEEAADEDGNMDDIVI